MWKWAVLGGLVLVVAFGGCQSMSTRQTGMVGDDFIINDPIGMNGHGERVLSSQQLLRAWMNSDFPGAAVAIARPL